MGAGAAEVAVVAVVAELGVAVAVAGDAAAAARAGDGAAGAKLRNRAMTYGHHHPDHLRVVANAIGTHSAPSKRVGLVVSLVDEKAKRPEAEPSH